MHHGVNWPTSAIYVLFQNIKSYCWITNEDKSFHKQWIRFLKVLYSSQQ